MGIAGRRGGVGGEIFSTEKIGLRPGSDSTDYRIDLIVCKRPAGALREGRHRSAWYAVGGNVANRGIVSDRQKNGVAQRNRRSSLPVVAVTSCTVLGVEDVEAHDLVGRDHL
jgi:hypothetical protein